EAPEQLAAALGAERVVGGLCGILAYIDGPGRIMHVAADPFVRFGELDNRPSERTRRLKDAFERARGLKVDIPADIQVAIWSKFLLICAMSGVGGATRAPIGVTRKLPETRGLLEALMREIRAVALARGVALPEDAIARAMGFFDALPENGTASMQRDILDGVPSELESQNGAVVRLGTAAGVPTPVNTAIHAALLPQELRSRGELHF
ncbi:MAG: ketopantoate reductase family protein, partial [Burkholderiales bacterium]